MPDWDDNDALAARNAQLRDTLDSVMREVRQRTEALKDVQAAVAALSGRASSPDGSVTAVVDSTGVLDRLELGPRAFERSTPEQLARTITAVVRQAAGSVRDQVSGAMAPLAEDGEPRIDLPDILPGAPSLRDMLRVEPRDETPPPPPPGDDFDGPVLRPSSAPEPPSAQPPHPQPPHGAPPQRPGKPAPRRPAPSDDDEDFGGNSIMNRGDSW
ncbi:MULTISPECIES: YbaB/EbfC family nucleoid-associated protein [Actinosynnema]|uniref:YbaB/EbfC family nucleoid-associated protein n=1 Tax=Actinosynnema TaxID=40566 RepID=UPI0020A48902|nr:YbaB/EbfC family nucleoid-associated protein [Actinosynnema pretiosum]MCP2095241.1 YbaB/EbfC DNA-binding family protein [Actinosynnema pretiosum]